MHCPVVAKPHRTFLCVNLSCKHGFQIFSSGLLTNRCYSIRFRTRSLQPSQTLNDTWHVIRVLEDIRQATFRLGYLSIYTFCLNKQHGFEEFGVTNTDLACCFWYSYLTWQNVNHLIKCKCLVENWIAKLKTPNTKLSVVLRYFILWYWCYLSVKNSIFDLKNE